MAVRAAQPKGVLPVAPRRQLRRAPVNGLTLEAGGESSARAVGLLADRSRWPIESPPVVSCDEAELFQASNLERDGRQRPLVARPSGESTPIVRPSSPSEAHGTCILATGFAPFSLYSCLTNR